MLTATVVLITQNREAKLDEQRSELTVRWPGGRTGRPPA
jgi:uncharacterized membrane protein